MIRFTCRLVRHTHLNVGVGNADPETNIVEHLQQNTLNAVPKNFKPYSAIFTTNNLGPACIQTFSRHGSLR